MNITGHVYIFLALPLLLLLTACPDPSTPQATLQPPAGFTATPGDGQVNLVWQASEVKDLAQYVIKLESEGDVPEDIVVTAPATGTTVKQLTNDKSYSFRIAVETKAKKRSDFSEAITATPKAPPPTNGEDKPKVATPTGLAVIAGDARVTVTWNANSDADLKGYTLFWGTAPDTLGESKPVDAPTTTTTVEGLTNGTTYFFALEAENTKGEKSARSTIETATPAAVLVQPAIESVVIEGYGPSLQARQGAAFVLNVKGQRLGNLSAATLGTLSAKVLMNTETDVGLELTIPHGQPPGFLALALTTGNGTATKNNAVEVTEISVAKSDKFKPSDTNPGTKERPFFTVTKALSVAASGDTVLLGAGTYEAGEAWPPNTGLTPNVPDGVTIVGVARNSVILQGPGLETATSALSFAGSASVRNLTVREFNRGLLHIFLDPDTQVLGGNLVLENLELSENHEGMFASRAFSVTIKDSTFLFNGSSGSGSGLALFDFADASLQSTTFTGNTYGLYASGARSVVLNNVTAEQSDLDGVHLENIYSSTLNNVVTVDNKNGVYVFNPGEASFALRSSILSDNKERGIVIAGGAYAQWDLGTSPALGGNFLLDNKSCQLSDQRDANTGVTINAEGNNLGGAAVAAGTYSASKTENGVCLWEIFRPGNSIKVSGIGF